MSLAETTPPSSPVAWSPSHVAWGPILAGASVATAIGLVLLGFGAAIGLGFASPYEGEGLSPAAFAIAAGLYLLWVQIMSFYCGGYVAARLLARRPSVSEHEADVRDGLHGLLVWSTGVVAAAVIAYAGLGGAGAAGRAEPTEVPVAAAVAEVVEQGVEDAAAREAQTEPEAATASGTERQVEIARKFSIIAAFISAASLLVGAVAAFFGAHSGGNHRDESVTWDFFTSRARVRSTGR